jgi:hypothetical protein
VSLGSRAIVAAALRACSIRSSTSCLEPTLCASVIPLQLAPSSAMPESAASFSLAQSTRTTPFAWKKAVSSISSAGDQPSAA